MSNLYDADILLWSEHQAALLKRLAAGERLNERPDWANIIAEMESVGRSEFNSVDALSRYTPSMRQRLDLAKLYRRALARLPSSIDGVDPLPTPPECPYALDELLHDV